jgi:nucleoside-diphosphate-sugar epimerase
MIDHSNRTVLVTGATGFIGRHCVPLLLERGFKVHAVTTNKCAVFAESITRHNLNLLQSGNAVALCAEIEPSHLLHLAWYAEPGHFYTSTKNVDWIRASIELLQAFAQSGGARVLATGTCAEYDWNRQWCREQEVSLHPASLYATAKLAMGSILNSYATQAGLEAAWARVFFTYGPNEHREKLISSVILSLLNNKTAVCSQPNFETDYLHVTDVASALVSILDSKLSGAINVGSGEAVSLGYVSELIARSLGKEHLLERNLNSFDGQTIRVVADVSRLQDELHWSPQISLESGLASTIKWWRQQEHENFLLTRPSM